MMSNKGRGLFRSLKGKNAGSWTGVKGRLVDLIATHFYSQSDGSPGNSDLQYSHAVRINSPLEGLGRTASSRRASHGEIQTGKAAIMRDESEHIDLLIAAL